MESLRIFRPGGRLEVILLYNICESFRILVVVLTQAVSIRKIVFFFSVCSPRFDGKKRKHSKLKVFLLRKLRFFFFLFFSRGRNFVRVNNTKHQLSETHSEACQLSHQSAKWNNELGVGLVADLHPRLLPRIKIGFS